MPTEYLVSFEDFKRHLSNVHVARGINEIIVHHTWRPTASDYRGIETVRGVRRYHMQVRGWSDNGYHVMIAPDGSIFMCRPLERSGAHTRGRNAHTIGVSFIANFDSEAPRDYKGLPSGIRVIAELVKRFDLSIKNIRFHREFAPKTCPGTKMSMAYLRGEVAGVEASNSSSSAEPMVVTLPDGEVISCSARVEEGVMRADLRPLLEGLGYGVYDHLTDQGKVYVRNDRGQTARGGTQ